MDTFIYFILSFAVYIQICEGLYGCNESIPTISYVESCPKNKTEWNIAARRKNCDSLAGLQKCTEPENFQYHCLENQRQTMTLEICAPIFYLQGYCARYSSDKKRVEENYENGFECLKFDGREKCPTRYPSTDAYKYQRCYKLKYQKPTQTACPVCTSPSPSPSSQSETAPIVTKKDLRNDTDDYIKTAFLVILALALAGVIVFFILFYKRDSPILERFRKVLTCDVETGPNDKAEMEKNTNEDVHVDEENEVKEPLLSKETAPDQEDKRVSATSDKDPARKDSTSLESTSRNNPFEENIPPSDFAVVSNSSSNAMPVIGIALASATISNNVTHSPSSEVLSSTPRVNDDLEKLNSDKDIITSISDNVRTSGQTSDIITASKQEPVDDASSKPKPDNETASTQKSNTFLNSTSNSDTEGIMKAKSDDHSLSKPKPADVSLQQIKSDAKNTSKPSKPENEPTEISIPGQDANEKKFKENPPKSNNGRSLKPVSNENIASESTSLEAPDSQQVSNDKAAADLFSASHTSSISVSPFESTKEDTKKVVIDDTKAIPTSMKNTSGSKALDNSASSSDQLSQNGTDVPKPIAQYQAAAKSTPKDVPALGDAPVSTLSTDNPAPGNDSSSKPMSENNPFDEDTTVSDLSNDNPAPDSCASKPISAINPFDEDSTPSATSEKDPAPNDSTNLKPISGNNPFEEDTPPSESRKKREAPRRPPYPHVTKIDIHVPQNAP
nr:cell surface glycoprotein 1 isoform X4 [Crassostrea gigas]